MKRCIIALSSNSVEKEAFAEISEQLKVQNAIPKVLIIFSELNLLGYCAKELQNMYPQTVVIGSSTYVNFSSEGYSHTGISVMALYDGVECTAGVLFEVGRCPCLYKQHITNAVNNLSSLENTCCLEFTTSFSNSEDLVLDTFQEVIQDKNIPLVGSSCGASPELKETYVTLNGELYRDSCVFVFIHNLTGPIKIFKENIYHPTSEKLTVTDVDCDEQLVYEYDGEMAAEKIAKILRVNVNNLKNVLAEHPMGRIVDNDIFITESNEVRDDGAISFFSRIYNHSKMVLLEVDDIKKVWNETSLRIKNEISESAFCISINSMSRSKLFEKSNIFGEFVNNLRQYGSFIGVSGYGEQWNNVHLNQTMLLVVFE